MINISKNSFSDTTKIILKSFKLWNHIVWIESNEAHFMGYLKGKNYCGRFGGLAQKLPKYANNNSHQNMFFSDPPKFIPAK